MVFLQFFFVVFAVSPPPRLGVVPQQGCSGGKSSKSRAGVSRKDRNEKVPPPQVQKWALSCLKYIQMRGILSFPPKNKGLETLGAL